MPKPLFDHQRRALSASGDREFFALFMEMGTGKSRTDIEDTVAAGTDGWLIVAPKGAYAGWIDQLREHLPTEVLERARLHLWRGGRSATEGRALETLMRPPPSGVLRVLVMNVEALSSGRNALAAAERFLRTCRRPKMTIDESTTIKNWKSNRTESCLHLAKFARRRRILTGMPVTKSPLDVYSQFEFLRPGLLGYRNYFVFQHAYAVTREILVGRRRVRIVVNFRNLEDLRRRVEPHSFRVTKEECLDLPPKIYMPPRDVELSDEQRRIYNSVRDDATAMLSSGDHVTATEVVTQLLRLHQIVCGHVVNEAGELVDLPCSRYDELCDVLEETGGPTIVWATYRRNVARIVEAIGRRFRGTGRRCVVFDGSTSDEDRASAVADFQAGRADWFVGNPATGRFFLTLTAARHVVYFSNSYNLEHRVQSEDRAHRIGQSVSVTYTDLRAPGTVDDKIIKTLRRGMDVAAAITGDDFREWIV